MLPSPWRPWGNAVSLQSGTHTGGERMEDTGGCSRDSYESSDTQTQERRGRGGRRVLLQTRHPGDGLGQLGAPLGLALGGRGLGGGQAQGGGTESER